MGGYDGHLQGALAYEGERASSMNQAEAAIIGDIPSASVVDLSAGLSNENYSVEIFVKNATDQDDALFYSSACATGTCGTQNYGIRPRPRTLGVKFSQNF